MVNCEFPTTHYSLLNIHYSKSMSSIEEILQQYGHDQRQQQEAARRLRRRAWRQTAVACIAVAAAIGSVVFFRLYDAPQYEPLTAQLQPTTPTTPQQTANAPLPASITHNVTRSAIHNPNTIIITMADTPDSGLTTADTLPSSAQTLAPISPALPIPSVAEPPATVPLIETSHLPTSPTTYIAMATPDRRLHFTATIGASTIQSINPHLSDRENNIFPNTNGYLQNSYSGYSTTIPKSSIHADVGMSYTLAANDKRHFDIGLSLSSYGQQDEVIIYRYENYSIFHSNDAIIDVIKDKVSNKTSLSLFVSVPLTLNMHPHRNHTAGWQLSLTPAHNIISTSHSTDITDNIFQDHYNINPWKLTFGIGMTLPYSIIRHISLTANLLPIYQYYNIHEFGIQVGF